MGAITFQQAFALAYGKYKDPGTGVTTTFTPPASLGNLLNGKPFLQASAALPGSITIPAGASFTIGKKTIKLPQTNASSLHFHGNPRIKAFITDLIAGTDSLDIVFVGDSNINYNNYGYIQGFASVLKSSSVPIYATPLFVSGSGGTAGATSAMLLNELGIVNNLSYITNYPAQLTKGSASAYTEITEKWNKGYVSLNNLTAYSASKAYTVGEEVSFSGQGYFCIQNTTPGTAPIPGDLADPYWNLITFQYGGTNSDIDWVAATGSNLASGYFSSIFSLEDQQSGIGVPDIFGRSGTINWRIGYATFPNSPNGRFTGVAYTLSPTTIRGEVTFSTNRLTGEPVYKVGVIPLVLAAPVTAITFNKYYYGSTLAKQNTPYGFLFESAVKANTKGFALSTLISSPGDQLNRRIKKPLVNTKLSTTSIFLKEIRERQIACGGTGRVMIFINAGVNGNESVTNWETGLNESISAIKEAWAFNGFPSDDIQFVVTASARTDASYQASTYTNQVAQHDKGIDIASKFFDISFVHIYNGLDAAAMGVLWDGAGASSVHLNANGYVTVSQLIFDQCRLFTAVKDISTDGGDINHNGKWIQAEKNYHDTGKPYFYGFLKKK